jgi:hypothetical protein
MTIHQDLARCIEDTKLYVNSQAANTLQPWTGYNIDQLITAIKRAIRIAHNQANGFFIARQGGMSLEQIVLDYPGIFNEADARIAGQTLGIHRR